MARYLGGLTTTDETQVRPANNFEDTAGNGVFTSDEQLMLNKQSLYPTAGNNNPDKFVENLFSVDVYTGNSGTQTITNGIDLSGEGGLVWIKTRDYSNSYQLYDTARGAGKPIYSNITNSEGTNPDFASFTSTGFTLGYTSALGGVNGDSNDEYVAWTFRKAPKFFDIVSWSGDNVDGRTISHNLGATPGFIMVKLYAGSGTENWICFHRSLTTNRTLYLNTTGAEANTGMITNVTSTGFDVDNSVAMNATGRSYIAYIFGHDTSDDGVIQCGNLTISSQASTNVALGFEPQWILLKHSSSTSNWWLFDTIRGMTPNDFEWLYANDSNAAETKSYQGVFPISTGFTFNPANNGQFTDGDYIYMAIRKAPMATPTSRASVFEVDQHHSGTPNYTTTFPVDMAINPTTAGGNVRLTSRILGNKKLLIDAAGSLEGGDSGQDYAHNDGVNLVDSSSYIAFMWRRAPKFFDVVTYVGTGSAKTENHNLGVTPEMIWVKNTTAYGQDWGVYYGDATDYLKLNSDAATADDNTFWNDTAPTSTVFTVGTHDSVNKNTNNHVAYLFATLAGISKVGTFSHTNGSSTDVDCGFSSGSRWVLVKRTDSTSDWYMWDTERGLVSGNDPYLTLNSTAAEVTNTDYIDTLNSGFQMSSSFITGTYIFYAIAA